MTQSHRPGLGKRLASGHGGGLEAQPLETGYLGKLTVALDAVQLGVNYLLFL